MMQQLAEKSCASCKFMVAIWSIFQTLEEQCRKVAFQYFPIYEYVGDKIINFDTFIVTAYLELNIVFCIDICGLNNEVVFISRWSLSEVIQLTVVYALYPRVIFISIFFLCVFVNMFGEMSQSLCF